jgi:hypothetical protein
MLVMLILEVLIGIESERSFHLLKLVVSKTVNVLDNGL